jgi:hypothetical protein
MPDDNDHETDGACNFRARFPRRGILTEQVEAAPRGEAGPAEGDKTHTWRALRNNGRGGRPREAGLLREPFTPAPLTTGHRPVFLCDD